MVIQVIKIPFCTVLLCILSISSDLFCFYEVFTISVLYCAHLWYFQFSIFDIFNFLEEISSLSPSVVFLFFFALFIEEGLLVSPCYSLEFCIYLGVSFPFSLAFHFTSVICKASSDNPFDFLLFISFEMILFAVS